MELQKRINQLFVEQRGIWSKLDSAIEQLSSVLTKEFSWGDNNNVIIQCHPNIASSMLAEIDSEKPCYLCEKNRPKEQKGIEFTNKYNILVNPFPVLNNHITIALHSHMPQRIRKKVGDMLDLAKELPNYVITYDSSQSSPNTATEHFHFQAGLKTEILMQGDNELRTCLVIESESKDEAEDSFEDVYYYLNKRQQDAQEPLMSIIAFVDKGKYILNIFPRKHYVSRQNNKIGSTKLDINPKAIDMAGLIIAYSEEAFNRIKKEDIEDMYSQISLAII